MIVNVLVNGAFGKMGQETVKAIKEDLDLNLVGEKGKTEDLMTIIKTTKPDVVIDFTTPHVIYQNALTYIDLNIHPVIGTSGLTAEQIEDLQQRCEAKKLGGIIAPNFSIGAVLMMQFARTAARYLPDVEIIESHHQGKLDSPSGTAVHTADLMAETRLNKAPPKVAKEIVAGARGALRHNIPIHAIRLPGFVASQEVLFGGQGETLSLRHNTIHREAFMAGVCLACKKVMKLNNLIVGLENILL